MATIGGGYTPGQATGYAEYFGGPAAGPAPTPIDYGGTGGYLEELWRQKRAMANLQLRMMQEQLNQMREGWKLQKQEASRRRAEAGKKKPRSLQEKLYADWKRTLGQTKQGGPGFGEAGFANYVRRVEAQNMANQLLAGLTGGASQRGAGGGMILPGAADPGIAKTLQAARAGGLQQEAWEQERTPIGPPMLGPGAEAYGARDYESGAYAPGMFAGDKTLTSLGYMPAGTALYGGATPGGGQSFAATMPSGYAPRRKGMMSQKEGTLPGTVEETGPALIHEGEVVLRKEQVDPPLMRYLIADAMEKGLLAPKSTPGHPPSYGCGSLKRYQGGTIGPEDAMALYQQMIADARKARDVGALPGSTAMVPYAGGPGTTPGRAPQIPGAGTALVPTTGPTAWQSPTLGAGPGAPTQAWTTAGIEPDVEMLNSWRDMVTEATPAQRKRLTAGMAKLAQEMPELGAFEGFGAAGAAEPLGAPLGRIPVAQIKATGTKAAKEAVEEITEAASKTPTGRRWMAAAGFAAPVAMGAISEDDLTGEDLLRAIALGAGPIGMPVAGVVDYIRKLQEMGPEATIGERLAAAPESIGETFTKGLMGWGRTVGKAGVAPLFRGIAGGLGIEGPGPAGEEERAEEGMALPAGPMEEPGLEGPITGEGTLEAPYTMEGELGPREQAYRELSMIPEQAEARRKAKNAELEVERLTDLLAKGPYAPETERGIMLRLKHHQDLMKKYDSIAQRREKAAELTLQAGAKLQSDIERIQATQEAIGERQKAGHELRQEALFKRQQVMILKAAHDSFTGGTAKEKNDALMAVAQQMQIMDPKLGAERAMDNAYQFMYLTPEQMQLRLLQLQE